jgi:hypothetical protein
MGSLSPSITNMHIIEWQIHTPQPQIQPQELLMTPLEPVITFVVQPLHSTTKSASHTLKHNASSWNSSDSKEKNDFTVWGILPPHKTAKHRINSILLHNSQFSSRTRCLSFCSLPFIPSLSIVLLRNCQKGISLILPWLEFINGIQQTSQPSQHNFSNTNHKIPIFIYLQQINVYTHRHINCPTFVTISLWLQGQPSHPLGLHWKNIHPFSSYNRFLSRVAPKRVKHSSWLNLEGSHQGKAGMIFKC